MKLTHLFAKCLFAAALPFAAMSSAHAAAYTFNVDYLGGGNATLAAGSDDLLAVVLKTSDTFVYRLIAAGTGSWTSVGGDVFPAFALTGNLFEASNLDFTFNLLQNGSTVFTYSELSAGTCCAHLGTNTVSLPAGTFDVFELLVSINATANTGPADSLLPWPGTGPELYSPNILSFDAGNTVPEPASLALVLAALGLAGAVKRRKQPLIS